MTNNVLTTQWQYLEKRLSSWRQQENRVLLTRNCKDFQIMPLYLWRSNGNLSISSDTKPQQGYL